ncbi:MAG: AarF/ABC1/UbiB kinase family protein [Pseudomonadota bacterium]
MTDQRTPRISKGVKIPTGRINRMARLGGLTTILAGNMAARGSVELLRGRKPRVSDLLLTPTNLNRVAEQLAKMRGAAMKAGQLLSMETSDFLPPELADILARLRSEAHFMPPAQLKRVLIANWGRDFLRYFNRFNVHPIAAASIGQVHRAQAKDGRELAIKVQYPGIRDSIDSDIRNLGLILRGSGAVPKSFDMSRLLEDAAKQLHEETDYLREGKALERFADHLANDRDFVVPKVYQDMGTKDILVMEFVEGVPIEQAETMEQETRDRIGSKLVELTLRELFELRDMQTDPNFANYRYIPETGQIILLDFGATREFAKPLVENFRALFGAAANGDDEQAFQNMIDVGLVGADTSESDKALILQIFNLAAEPMRKGGVLDFGSSGLLGKLRREGMVLADENVEVHAPPTDTLLMQRKVLGGYLLAERLRARVDLDPLLERFL